MQSVEQNTKFSDLFKINKKKVSFILTGDNHSDPALEENGKFFQTPFGKTFKPIVTANLFSHIFLKPGVKVYIIPLSLLCLQRPQTVS